MNVAVRNANDAISLAQTAEGALAKIGDMGQRMRELAVQSANATNSDDDRAHLNAEYLELAKEIKRTLEGTNFNGTNLFSGQGAALVFQVGANNADTDRITVNTTNLAGEAGFTAVIGAAGAANPDNDISDVTKTNTSLEKIDDMLKLVNTERARYGATQNRFEAVISTLRINAENQTAARSRIMDADFSQETAALTRSQVLQQAGTAMLSQANSIPNNVLSLLR